MFNLLSKLLLGPLLGKLVDLYKGYNERQVTEAQLRRDIEKVILGTFKDVSQAQADVIMAEMKGENWMQRNWRPVTAVCFAFIVFFYGILLPISVDWLGMPPVRVGDELLRWIMDAVMLCLGGYIGGRTLEKIVSTIRK